MVLKQNYDSKFGNIKPYTKEIAWHRHERNPRSVFFMCPSERRLSRNIPVDVALLFDKQPQQNGQPEFKKLCSRTQGSIAWLATSYEPSFRPGIQRRGRTSDSVISLVTRTEMAFETSVLLYFMAIQHVMQTLTL